MLLYLCLSQGRCLWLVLKGQAPEQPTAVDTAITAAAAAEAAALA